MAFQTRYGQGIAQVLASYGVANPSAALIGALEVMVKTAEQNGKTMANTEIAQTVCEGLHAGPAAGLKCLKCYHAEHHFHEEAVVQAEIDGGEKTDD